MNALVLTLALLLSISAFAREGHDGPEASLPMQAPVIAKLVVSSGFVPPTVPVATTIQIHADGVVERVLSFQSGPYKTEALATLSSKIVSSIAASVAKVKESKIVDPSPANPGCMDAPVETYYAVQGSKEVIVAQRENCKEMAKTNESQADLDTKRALDAVAALGSLAR